MRRNVLLVLLIIISLTKPIIGKTEEQCSSAEHTKCQGANGSDASVDESKITSALLDNY